MLDTVSDWISSLKRGNPAATQKIWERYYQQLVQVANRRLRDLPQRAADKEDVAQEAFANFFRAIEQNRFPKLDDRNDLWHVLLAIVDRRAKDRMRHDFAAKRGSGDVKGESAVAAGSSEFGIHEVEGRIPEPETVDGLIDLLRTNWRVFDDATLCQIAVDKLQGYENREISDRCQISLRGVERKLNLIRRLLNEAE